MSDTNARLCDARERKGVAFCACLSTVCDHQVPSQVVLCRIGAPSLPLQFYTDLPFNTHSFSSVYISMYISVYISMYISMYTSVNIRANLFVCMQPLRERGGEEGQMSTDTNRDSNKPPPFNLTASDTGAGLTGTGTAAVFLLRGLFFLFSLLLASFPSHLFPPGRQAMVSSSYPSDPISPSV